MATTHKYDAELWTHTPTAQLPQVGDLIEVVLEYDEATWSDLKKALYGVGRCLEWYDVTTDDNDLWVVVAYDR